MTLSEYLEEKTTLLSRAGIPDAENEAWLCFMEGTGLNRSAIRFSLPKALSSVVSEFSFGELEEIFARRAEHEPLSYIVGRAPFYDLTFSVGEGVLIPRFDTEILVETALGALGFPQMLPGAPALPQVTSRGTAEFLGASASHEPTEPRGDSLSRSAAVASPTAAPIIGSDSPTADPIRILDLCTGSGCVGITIAHELHKKGIAYQLTMTEIFPKASAFAEENAKEILGTGSWRVEIADLWPKPDEGGDAPKNAGTAGIKVDLETQAAEGRSDTKAAVGRSDIKYDLIVSNPPYVTKAEMTELAPEVRDHEPAMALTDEGDGLAFYRRIADGLTTYLAPGGVLAVEHGCAQGAEVRGLLEGVLSDILTIEDYGGLDRVTCGKLREDAAGAAE